MSCPHQLPALIPVMALAMACLMSGPAQASPKADPRGTAEQRININTADAELLDEALVGIGPGKARAIVAWRRQHGAFRDLRQLEEVKGLGPSFTARNKDRMRLQ